jgi:hypothetical protein
MNWAIASMVGWDTWDTWDGFVGVFKKIKMDRETNL